MTAKFIPAADVVREQPGWGSMGWCCRPKGIGSEKLVMIEVTLAPGGGHAFHMHPQQEESIYVIDGEVEQWLGEECRVLRPGDCVFLPAGAIHASFNKSTRDCKLLAVLSPCTDSENGYEVTELADQEPWRGLMPTA